MKKKKREEKEMHAEEGEKTGESLWRRVLCRWKYRRSGKKQRKKTLGCYNVATPRVKLYGEEICYEGRESCDLKSRERLSSMEEKYAGPLENASSFNQSREASDWQRASDRAGWRLILSISSHFSGSAHILSFLCINILKCWNTLLCWLCHDISIQ